MRMAGPKKPSCTTMVNDTNPGLKVYILNFVLSQKSCSELGSEGHVGLVLNVREAELPDIRQEDDL